MRYAPGKEPAFEREYYERILDADWKRILRQDIENYEHVQAGMKSMPASPKSWSLPPLP